MFVIVKKVSTLRYFTLIVIVICKLTFNMFILGLIYVIKDQLVTVNHSLVRYF